MTETEKDPTDEPGRDQTAPPDPTHEATTPPGQGDLDERALKEAEDRLEQAGGGY